MALGNTINRWLTWSAVVDVCLTLLSCVSLHAPALVAAHRVEAGGAVTARTLHALVDVYFTGLTWRCERERHDSSDFFLNICTLFR